MFGGEINPPKCIRRTRPNPLIKDIYLSSTTPGYRQHVGRDPNTDQNVQMLHYKQRKNAGELLKIQNESKRLLKEAFDVEYDNHIKQAQLEKQIQIRVQKKLDEFDKSIERRRERLKQLICTDECEIQLELTEKSQKGDEEKLMEMKIRSEQLKAEREAERLKLVEKKRMEQYKNRMWEFRPELIKRNLIESKNCQLQQIKDKEMLREAEKEIDQMWNHVKHKEIEAQTDREKQDLLNKKRIQQDLKETWSKQLQGKEILKQEIQRIAKEDQMELEKLNEKLKNEEIRALEEKRRLRDLKAQELLEQIALHEKLLKQRKSEEEAFDKAFSHLMEQELQKEQEKSQNLTGQLKRESNLYKKYLQEMELQRKQEEKLSNELLEKNRKEIERKQDEARCKLIEAKQQLLKSVLEGRAEQLKYKQEEARQQLKLKETENEVVRMAWETNRCLQQEQERMAAEAAKQYRDDLQKQIEFNRELQKREQEQLARQLAEGLQEEEHYRKIMQDLLNENYETRKHPFRTVLDQSDCKCLPQQ